MSLQSRINALREQPETARVGVKWTEEENDQLMKEVMEGMDLEEIAKKHQRTITGVKSRVMSNALTIMNERDLSLQDVAKLVHISLEDMELHKQRQEQKASAPKAKKTVPKAEEQSDDGNISYHDLMSVLTEIRDYLKIIAEK